MELYIVRHMDLKSKTMVVDYVTCSYQRAEEMRRQFELAVKRPHWITSV